MGARTDFPNINAVFGCLHINWKDEYDWQNKKPSYQAVIRYYKIKSSEEAIDAAIADLKSLTEFGKTFDDEEWYDYFMSDSSLGYYPPGDGLTEKEWLEDVLKILEEPIEETRKHFIPTTIFDVKWEKLSDEEKREYNEYQKARDRLRELGYSSE